MRRRLESVGFRRPEDCSHALLVREQVTDLGDLLFLQVFARLVQEGCPADFDGGALLPLSGRGASTVAGANTFEARLHQERTQLSSPLAVFIDEHGQDSVGEGLCLTPGELPQLVLTKPTIAAAGVPCLLPLLRRLGLGAEVRLLQSPFACGKNLFSRGVWRALQQKLSPVT